ncbi:hypothetical protein EES47_25915 [Streptomyces sp. ADI98-12]|nr:hypothetical protein [Streptomyces sp. DSM 41037]RPK82702.1 hypothetical protein EES47_25915 [Streptomyces sp. ADI98-12]
MRTASTYLSPTARVGRRPSAPPTTNSRPARPLPSTPLLTVLNVTEQFRYQGQPLGHPW